MVEELKASQEKSFSQASELHVKELEVLQSQVDKLKQELSSSKNKTEDLEKLVSELQPYKEQAQVSTNAQRDTLVGSTCTICNCKNFCPHLTSVMCIINNIFTLNYCFTDYV